MSRLKINKVSDLELFLKILAEESVSRARQSINETDPAFSKFSKDAVKKDLKSIMGEAEDEEAEEAEPEEKASAPGEKEHVASSAPESGAGEEEKGTGEAEGPLEITWNMVKSAINDVRAGGSLSRETGEEVETWVMSVLNGDELRLFYDYVNTLGKVMLGEVPGSKAHDPSDPPTSLNITTSKPQAQADTGKAEADTEEESEEEEVSSGPEDTTPPLPVVAGSPQSMSEIKRRIRRLMEGNVS